MQKEITKKLPLIGIVGGTGKLGQWFKGFFERNGLEVVVSGRKTELTQIELAKKADIVIVCVPIEKTAEVIKDIRKHVRKDALLADFTSIKVTPLKEMAKAKSGVLGMHPLFGPLVPTIENQAVVFCRKRDNKWVDFLKKIFIKNGANVIEISAQEHDKQMAYIQALLHFSNIAYSRMFALEKFKPMAKFLTPAFKLQSLVFGRILFQDPKLYAAIEMENDYFPKLLKKYGKEIASLAKIVEKKNYAEFEKKFMQSRVLFRDLEENAQKKTSDILEIVDRQIERVSKPKQVGKLDEKIFKEGTIGFLGPEGTFSWKAAKDISGEVGALKAFSSIRDVFKSVSEGESALGIVPIQNTIGGVISETMGSFTDFSVFSLASFKIQIHHCLASRGDSLEKIKIVKTHSQPLMQCKKWLENNLPNATKEATASTVAPVQVSENLSDEVAFILPIESAKKFNLNILAENIEDDKNNFTRFLVISKDFKEGALKGAQTSNTLLLLSVYDRRGVLRDILSIFADKGINLSAIHSIPSYSKPWDYMFFLEVEKEYFEKNFQAILKELEQFCQYQRVIGVV